MACIVWAIFLLLADTMHVIFTQLVGPCNGNLECDLHLGCCRRMELFTFFLLAVFFTNSGQHVWRIETWDIFMYFMCYSTDGSQNWYLCSLCTWLCTYQKVIMYGFKIYACFGNTLGADGKWVRSLQQGCWSLKIHAFKCQFCGHWSLNDLEAALKDIRKKKASIRAAGAAHGVPKSTLFDYENWSSWNRQQVWSRWQLPLVSCL